eukprot:jgi/Ulvmu1/608/UM001_0616.1
MASRATSILQKSVLADVGLGVGGVLIDSLARGLHQAPRHATGLLSTRPHLSLGVLERGIMGHVQKRAYSAIVHELPILDTHHLFRVVATCSVVAALSNAWFSGSGIYGDASSHVALLRGSPQMRTAGLSRMQRAISQKDSDVCLQEFKESGVFEALIHLMRIEEDVDVWRQLCRTVGDICDSPALYRELASSRICTVLSQRLETRDEEFQSAAAVLVHKLVSRNGSP